MNDNMVQPYEWKRTETMTPMIINFAENRGLDIQLIDKMVNDNLCSGMDLLDYINSKAPMTEDQWSCFVDGKRYADKVISRKPADKKPLVVAIVRRLNK